jgi:transposase
VRTVKRLLADFKALGFENVKLVLDCGFYSGANVDLLLKDGVEFLVSLRMSLSFVREELDRVYDEISSFENYSEQYELYSLLVPVDGGAVVGGVGGRVFLHLFFDVEREAEDKKVFDRGLAVMRSEFLCGKCKKEYAKGYVEYFTVKGFWLLMVVVWWLLLMRLQWLLLSVILGFLLCCLVVIWCCVEAFGLYRNRDLVEKAFGNVKDKVES